MAEELLTASELSKELKIPESTLAQWRYLNRGPRYQKLGGHVRYPRGAITAWQAECEQVPDAVA